MRFKTTDYLIWPSNHCQELLVLFLHTVTDVKWGCWLNCLWPDRNYYCLLSFQTAMTTVPWQLSLKAQLVTNYVQSSRSSIRHAYSPEMKIILHGRPQVKELSEGKYPHDHLKHLILVAIQWNIPGQLILPKLLWENVSEDGDWISVTWSQQIIMTTTQWVRMMNVFSATQPNYFYGTSQHCTLEVILLEM